MTNLTDTRMLWIKAGLFVLCGTIAASLLLIERPTVRCALLIVVAIWSFCRAYYFVFYVIERYIDSEFRFRGLTDVIRYMAGSRRSDSRSASLCHNRLDHANNQSVSQHQHD